MGSKNKKGGISIIGIIILCFILILILSYYKISIRNVVESPEAQDNIHYVTDTSKSFWERYLKDPATYIWNDIFIDLLWDPFVQNLKHIKNQEPMDIQNMAPIVEVNNH